MLALRLYGQRSGGDNADFFNFGGNSEMRGYEYLEFIGHKGFFANAELRFPLIEAMLTPIGVLGGLRGVVLRQRRRRGLQQPAVQVDDQPTTEIVDVVTRLRARLRTAMS